MLRFLPDDWLEGLLRPLILADPVGYVYFELPAPDVRFAALAVLTAIVVASGGADVRKAIGPWRTLGTLLVMFYLWTFISGNGRYFIAGLLLVGPLLILIIGRLPFTQPMRLLILVALIGLQASQVQDFFNHGMWAIAAWRNGNGLPLGKTPLRDQPAAFLMMSANANSNLVPQFHPASRWANISDVHFSEPGSFERKRLDDLLKSPLSRYLILPILAGPVNGGAQPTGEVDVMIQHRLARSGLERDGRPCTVLQSHLMLRGGSGAQPMAYWFCPLRSGPTVPARVATSTWDDVFAAVERRCPRFFPPGRGMLTVMGDVVLRFYADSDTRLYVHEDRVVRYRYHRALNPTLIGTVDQVRSGKFALACHKLPGRYVYPWQRD